MNHFPESTTVRVTLDRLIAREGNRQLSQRLSSRMVKCASVLEREEHLGWQLLVPEKGLVRMELFGSGALRRDDLEWMAEEMARTGSGSLLKDSPLPFSEVYELYLPVAEERGTSTIGFGASGQRKEETIGWPWGCPVQFGELIGALRRTGGMFRGVIGPACREEQLLCQKNTLRTFDAAGIDPREYIGRPVRARFLFRFPQAPSIRLRAVLEEAAPGAKLRYLGTMDQPKARQVWKRPLAETAVLPDYAARILLLEPELHEAVPGIRLCGETPKKIPASHKVDRGMRAVAIGKAVDTAGVRRKITIGEADLQRHYQIVGQTGTGKSTLLATILRSAVEHGYGLTFFDPHGSTIDSMLRALPERYAGRVRVVRIGDTEHPVPLNLWNSGDPRKEERTISDLCELFGDLFDPRREGIVGPRYERWLSTFAQASIALLGRRASLESIAVISQDRENMQKVSRILMNRYPELAQRIQSEYAEDRSNEFQNTLNWYLSKFQRLTSIEQLRKTLGAGTNALNFGQTVDTDAVTLIDLASPTIGVHAARSVGTLLMMQLWNAVLARKQRNRTHLVMVDEASLFQTNPVPRMLAEGRKFGLSMILSHQHTGQLTAEVRDALEANAANFSAFRLSPRDASGAAMRFDVPGVQAVLARQNAFQAVTTLSVKGRQTAPFTLEVCRPKQEKHGEEIARRIEEQSWETLVRPYQSQRALTPGEIQRILDWPAQEEPEPVWLDEWARCRNALGQAV